MLAAALWVSACLSGVTRQGRGALPSSSALVTGVDDCRACLQLDWQPADPIMPLLSSSLQALTRPGHSLGMVWQAPAVDASAKALAASHAPAAGGFLDVKRRISIHCVCRTSLLAMLCRLLRWQRPRHSGHENQQGAGELRRQRFWQGTADIQDVIQA